MAQTKEQIAAKQKQATLSIKLSDSELTRLKNEAVRAGFGDEWRDYATKRFREEVTGGLIGQATVGTFKTVTQPTNRYGQ